MYKSSRSHTSGTPFLANTLYSVFVIVTTAALSACNITTPLGAITVTPDTSSTVATLTGSVGDGPVVGALVTLTDANGNVIASSISDVFADYSIEVPAGTAFPVIIKATGGTDVVTGTTPTYALLSVVTGPGESHANINPFSTLIVKTAQNLPGGLTDQNLQTATQYVLNTFNAGLDTALVPNPISTSIGVNNVATMIKASEVLAEIIRRTRTTLQAGNANLTDDDIINALAADLSDGVLDGAGSAGTRSDVSVIATITSGQVLIEALSNNLAVNGAAVTSMLDDAIKVSSPTSIQTTADLTATVTILTQAELAVQTAQQISSDPALADLGNALSAVTPGMQPAQVAAVLPPSRSADLNNAIGLVTALSDQQLATVNDWLRTAHVAAPVIVTLSATPSDISEDQTTQLSVTATYPKGDTLSYVWQPESGTITGSGATVTFNPPAVTTDTTIRINVTVTNSSGQSATGTVNVMVRNVATSAPSTNIGPQATASASSEKTSTGQTAAKAVDGVVDGFGGTPGDYTKEWATLGGAAGSWLRLDWPSAYVVDHVVLHDRPNLNDQVLSGTLQFSDGTSVPVGALPNDGTGLTVTFTPRTVSWITLSIDSVSSTTSNAGLAELEVYGSAAQTGGTGNTGTSSTTADTPPANILSPTQLSVASDTASSYDVSNNLVPANAVDGNSQTSWSVLSMPQWTVLDLGGQQLLSGVKMLAVGANGGANISYTIATSLDNLTWTQVFNGTSVSVAPQWTEADFGPVYARYIRLDFNSTVSSDYLNIYEIVPIGRDMTQLGSTPTNTTVTINWRPNSEPVDGYILYFGTTADTVTTEITKVTNSSTNFDPTAPSLQFDTWNDFGLLPGDNVCFKLQAYNASGISSLSPAVCSAI